METNSNNGGMTPSALALKDSLIPKQNTSSAPTMLTPLQKELLLRAQIEIDERLNQSPRLQSWIDQLHRTEASVNDASVSETNGTEPVIQKAAGAVAHYESTDTSYRRQGAEVEVIVLPREESDGGDLLRAAETSLSFWDNPIDDEVWNDA